MTIIKRKIVKKPKFASVGTKVRQSSDIVVPPDAHYGPPPRDDHAYYGSAYSVPVWVDAGNGRGACVRWSFGHTGWVDYNWRDGTSPRDNSYLAKIPRGAAWILLPFHVAGRRP